MLTTKTKTGTYTHLETRDIHADLTKAKRKWPGRPRAQLRPIGELTSLIINQLHARLANETGTISVHLFKSTKPQIAKLNREIRFHLIRHADRVNIVEVDPAAFIT